MFVYVSCENSSWQQILSDGPLSVKHRRVKLAELKLSWILLVWNL